MTLKLLTKEILKGFYLLQTWRQLWRVLEISDVVLLIADVRHPVSHTDGSVFQDLILVLCFHSRPSTSLLHCTATWWRILRNSSSLC